ncbi:hypothetical protein A5765_15745 [Mycolicibacterium celeriflavum]|uniref:hypothetical protein n=1 Tax=Mycolicibacterium celeriflavum TaxID=1249101 RepID=UPI0007FCECB4|nr:hypothetical protein [Mycolicibacterium celeriflavum]OBG12016.1 hypothetical protein A5765_15745 [Mycolicibacterium celeriflavum]
MFDLPTPARRLAGAAVLGVALIAGPAVAALTDTDLESVAEPACTGSESVVDGKPTCVPAPTAPDASNPASGPVDSREHDGGHH